MKERKKERVWLKPLPHQAPCSHSVSHQVVLLLPTVTGGLWSGTSSLSVSPERSSTPASPQNYAISSSAFCQRSRQRALPHGVSCCTTGLCPGPCLPPRHPLVHFSRWETDHLAYKIVTLATSPLKQSSPSRNDQQQVNSPKCSHRRGCG